MVMQFSATLSGVEGLHTALRETVAKSADLREMKDALRGEYTRANEENLLSEGALVGGWAPLSRRTISDKRRRGYGGKRIEERTGRLFRSLTEFGSEGFFEEVDRDEITWNSTINYAARQHGGDEAGNLPGRQLRPEPRVERYAEIFRDHAAETGRLSGFEVV